MAQENDVVLIYLEDEPLTFARIEEILPDHKKNWFHVKLLMLQLPLQAVTWILKDLYIDGGEFTMNGQRMRLERVVCPEIPGEASGDDAPGDEELLEEETETDEAPDTSETPETEESDGGAQVISFMDRKKS